MLDNRKILNELNTKYIGKNIICLDKTTSTNDVVKLAGENGEKEGYVVTAEEQTNGRGRQGKKWLTAKGNSIAMSLLLRPQADKISAVELNFITIVSIVEGIFAVTGVQTGIKWPNDIYLDYFKLGGVLIETSFNENNIEYVVIGIGINVNQELFDTEIENTASSLRRQTGRSYGRELVVASILNHLESNYEETIRGGSDTIYKKYLDKSIVLGKDVIVLNNENSIEGSVKEVSRDGLLIIEEKSGGISTFLNGEVSLKLKK